MPEDAEELDPKRPALSPSLLSVNHYFSPETKLALPRSYIPEITYILPKGFQLSHQLGASSRALTCLQLPLALPRPAQQQH